MIWIIPVGIAVAGIGYLLSRDSEEDVEIVSHVSCHHLFESYVEAISLTSAQEKKLDKCRRTLQDVIRASLYERSNVSFKGFFIQGSKSPTFRTVIIKPDGTYDVDLGVFLTKKPDVSSRTVQTYLHKAVSQHTKEGAKHMEKCVRVVYSGAFNIDLTIYALTGQDTAPLLATKSTDWVPDDTRGVSNWFRSKKSETDSKQLVRVIKCLKRWCSELGYPTPNGFALTVWAADKFNSVEDRDDIALFQTLLTIQETVSEEFACEAPAEPKDNLVAKLKDRYKKRFMEDLAEFINDAEEALAAETVEEAAELWRKHLGDKFPYTNKD